MRESKPTSVDEMFEDLIRNVPALPPVQDVAVHGLRTAQIAEKMACSIPTAQTLAEKQLRAGRWVATKVRYTRTNGSMGYAMAYRAKGGSK